MKLILLTFLLIFNYDANSFTGQFGKYKLKTSEYYGNLTFKIGERVDIDKDLYYFNYNIKLGSSSDEYNTMEKEGRFVTKEQIKNALILCESFGYELENLNINGYQLQSCKLPIKSNRMKKFFPFNPELHKDGFLWLSYIPIDGVVKYKSLDSAVVFEIINFSWHTYNQQIE